MAIEKISYSMEIPKESKEVVDFIDMILEKVMNKAPIAEYATLLVGIMPAIDGVGKLGEEMKSDGRDEVAAYLVHKVMGRLMPVKEEENK